MGNLFSKNSKKKDSKVNDHDIAVLKLKGARDKLEIYQKRLEIVIEEEVKQARILLSQGKKDRALTLMRRKKMQERMIITANGQLDNVLTMIDDVQVAQANIEISNAMKAGLSTLQSLQKELDVETAQKLMDDTAEAYAIADEINQILSESLSPEDDEEAYESLMVLAKEQDEKDAAILKAKLDAVNTSDLDPLTSNTTNPTIEEPVKEERTMQAA